MNEALWHRAKVPQQMLDYLRGRTSERKFRLLVCALARRVWHILPEASRGAVGVAERLADGRCSEEERLEAFEAAGGGWSALYSQADCIPAKALMLDNLEYYCADAADSVTQIADKDGQFILESTNQQRAEEAVAQCALVRELFGNPFRPVTFAPEWLTPGVVGLARTAYDEGSYDLLGILGDALEDAGCRDADILGHCRQPGGHVRGCWVVDGVLGFQ